MFGPLITPRDLIATPDQEITLEVEAEASWLPFVDPAARDAELEIDGIGRATTDSCGVARFPLGRLAAGSHRFRAVLVDGGASGEALVSVVPPDAPIAVIDIDRTISKAPILAHGLLPNALLPAVAGAQETLIEISRRLQVVYLTARDHIYIPKTKAWLRLRGFPEGPVYARKRRFWSQSSRDHKMSRLSELRPAFTNIRCGVGDTRGDMEAYAAAGIPAILLGRAPSVPLPAGTRSVPSWRDIPPLIES